jgi:hypothetical protein
VNLQIYDDNWTWGDVLITGCVMLDPVAVTGAAVFDPLKPFHLAFGLLLMLLEGSHEVFALSGVRHLGERGQDFLLGKIIFFSAK